MAAAKEQVITDEWVTFPGGELEGQRPKALCAACREVLKREAATYGAPGAARRSRLLCFDCYRADLARTRALNDAAAFATPSEERFQSQLPFEPVNKPRLERLKAERIEARTTASQGIGRYADKRRHAQIEARHALQRIAEGLRAHRAQAPLAGSADADAIHAAELQLPDAWLPFVVSR